MLMWNVKPRSICTPPIGLPDVQGVGVCDASFICLLLQEVKEVFNSQRGLVRWNAEDGLKQVIQELLECSLQREKIMGQHLPVNSALWAIPVLPNLLADQIFS